MIPSLPYPLLRPEKLFPLISFNRYFYKPQPLRSLEEIRADLLAVEQEAAGLLDEIFEGTET